MPPRLVPMPMAVIAACLAVASPVAFPAVAQTDDGQAGRQAGDRAVRVTCLVGDPLAARLCDAVQAALRDGDGRDRAAPLHLVLDAHSPRPDTLTARLSRAPDAASAEGAAGDARVAASSSEPLTLSVMDRATIPDDRITAFAGALIRDALSFSD